MSSTPPRAFSSAAVGAVILLFGALIGCSADETPSGADHTVDAPRVEPVRGAVFAGSAACPSIPQKPVGLIDDFEDGDLELPSGQGLSGTWFTENWPGGTPSIGSSLAVEPDPDDPENRVLHVAEGDADGAALSVYFSAGALNCVVDAAAFDAIAFRVRLAGAARLEIAIPGSEPLENGGVCASADYCDSPFGVDLVGDGTWQERSVPFNAMETEGLGGCFTSTLLGMRVRLARNQVPDELWLDDIRLVRRADPPDCSGPRPVLETGKLSDFENGSLNVPAPLGGAWSADGATLEITNIDGHSALHGVGKGAWSINATFETAPDSRCGGDARAFDGIELQGRILGPDFGLGYSWHVPTEDSFCQICPNDAYCGRWSQQLAFRLQARAGFQTYRIPFHPGSGADNSRLLGVSLSFDAEVWIDHVELYSRGDAKDFGAGCTTDSECVTGHCRRGAGAPADGLCAAYCWSRSCQGWPGGCDLSSDGKPCSEECLPNDSSEPGPNASKCHGRSDMACQSFGDYGLCIPRCMEDSQCGWGLYCGKDGNCTTTRPTGLAHGSACDLDGITGTCAFECAALTHTCTKLCPIGCERSDCVPCPGATERCLPLLDSLGPRDDSRGTGDLGACATPCDCNADCSGGLVCLPVTLEVPLEKLGICATAEFAGAGIFDCPTACAQGAVHACHGDDGCLGVADCLADESGYGPCRCPEHGNDAGAGGEAGDAQGGAPPIGFSGGAGNEADQGGAGGAPEKDPPGAEQVAARTLDTKCTCSAPGGSAPRSTASAFALLLALALARRRSPTRRRLEARQRARDARDCSRVRAGPFPVAN